MLHSKSKPDDILHYIKQMEMLLLSDKEKNQISQIMSLENLIKDDAIKDLIEEDLANESWISGTQLLINACCQKVEKALIVQKHINECKNFMVYRFLEDKAYTVELEIYKQISGWNFNEIDKHGEKNKWVSQKFIRAFDSSSLHKVFEEYLKETNILHIDLKWLHTNRKIFFSENIFTDLNIQLKKVLSNKLIEAE